MTMTSDEVRFEIPDPHEPRDGVERHWLAIGLAVLLGLDALFTVGVVLAVGAPWWVGLVAAGGIIASVGLVWVLMKLLWSPWRRRFPARPVAPGAVRRSWQSARLGLLSGFNHCLEIDVDESYIHLRLMPPFHWLAPGQVSIPAPTPDEVRRHGCFESVVTFEVDGRRVTLPAWTVTEAPFDAVGAQR